MDIYHINNYRYIFMRKYSKKQKLNLSNVVVIKKDFTLSKERIDLEFLDKFYQVR